MTELDFDSTFRFEFHFHFQFELKTSCSSTEVWTLSWFEKEKHFPKYSRHHKFISHFYCTNCVVFDYKYENKSGCAWECDSQRLSLSRTISEGGLKG